MMPMSYRNLVCDTIEAVSSLNSLSQIGAALADAVARLGFSASGISALPPPEDDSGPVILTERTPAGFRDAYFHERLYAVNHLSAHAKVTNQPFRFSDAPYAYGETRRRERFLQALETWGIGKGIMVPIARWANIPACIWFAGKNPELHDDAMLATQMISLFAASKVQMLSPPPQEPVPSSRLTVREREILQWISAGKTSWEVSVISGLSESAINNIIAGAMKKLDAVTRVQAVANAIRRGEIEL